MIINLEPDDIDNILTMYNDFALNVQMSQDLRRNLVIEFKKTLDKICSQYTLKNKKFKLIRRAKKCKH